MRSLSIYNYLFYSIIISLINLNNCIKLRGVTLPAEPYVERFEAKSGQYVYTGFLVDLMDEISRISKFEYDLYYAPDMKYGDVEGGGLTGLIGEVSSKRADFALADLTITEKRRNYVDFTKPYRETNIAALIDKSNVENIKTLSDLAKQTKVKYGIIGYSSTYQYFHESKLSLTRNMFNAMLNISDNFVSNLNMAIHKVKTSEYAYITDEITLEYAAKSDCNLTVLKDINNDFSDFNRQYAIAVRINSQFMNLFNPAIDELLKNGSIDKLKDKYWQSECEVEIDTNSSLSKNINILSVILFGLFSHILSMN